MTKRAPIVALVHAETDTVGSDDRYLFTAQLARKNGAEQPHYLHGLEWNDPLRNSEHVRLEAYDRRDELPPSGGPYLDTYHPRLPELEDGVKVLRRVVKKLRQINDEHGPADDVVEILLRQCQAAGATAVVINGNLTPAHREMTGEAWRHLDWPAARQVLGTLYDAWRATLPGYAERAA